MGSSQTIFSKAYPFTDISNNPLSSDSNSIQCMNVMKTSVVQKARLDSKKLIGADGYVTFIFLSLVQFIIEKLIWKLRTNGVISLFYHF